MSATETEAADAVDEPSASEPSASERSSGPPGNEPRPEKVAVVAEVKERLSSSRAAVLTEYRGLSVTDMATLRRNVRDAGGEFKIYKNTLVRFAVQELGLELEDLLTGPNAIAFVEDDAVGVAKALRDYARDNENLVIKGGLLGTQRLSAAEVDSLAKLPSRDELLARLAGGLAAPLQKMAGLLQALPRSFAYGLRALIDQGGAPGAPQPEAPAAEPAEPQADAEAEAPEAEAEATEPDATEPEAAEPEAAEPEAAATEAEPEATAPEAEPAASEPEATEPEAEATEPAAEATDESDETTASTEESPSAPDADDSEKES